MQFLRIFWSSSELEQVGKMSLLWLLAMSNKSSYCEFIRTLSGAKTPLQPPVPTFTSGGNISLPFCTSAPASPKWGAIASDDSGAGCRTASQPSYTFRPELELEMLDLEPLNVLHLSLLLPTHHISHSTVFLSVSKRENWDRNRACV